MFEEVRKFLEMYTYRGFEAVDVIYDFKFEPIRQLVAPVELKTVSSDNHLG